MPTCVPIKGLKNTADFTRTVESAAGSITVTRNGYDAFVVMKTDEYEAMCQKIAKAGLVARIVRAEREYAAGRYSDGGIRLVGEKQAWLMNA